MDEKQLLAIKELAKIAGYSLTDGKPYEVRIPLGTYFGTIAVDLSAMNPDSFILCCNRKIADHCYQKGKEENQKAIRQALGV